MNFDEAYKRLNEISALMDNSEQPIEEAIALYSEAVKLVEICKGHIDSAKLTVEKLDAEKQV